MARPINQITIFRGRIKALLDALEEANAQAQVIDYLGGQTFVRDELQKVDANGVPVHDITPVQFGNAVEALAAIKALLEADNQTRGKALARMDD